MTEQTRNLLISLASHMAYMQGQLEAFTDQSDPEDFYWYRESVTLRQKVTDALAEGDGPASVDGEPSDEELLERQAAGLAARPLLEQVAAIGDCISEQTVGQVRALANRAAAWLAENPPGQSVAIGEVAELVAALRNDAINCTCSTLTSGDLRRAADLLEQLSAQAPVPVAVSERLPQPEDCDAEGRCWLLTVEDDYPQWRLHSIQGAQPGGAMIWVPVDSSPGVLVDCFYTSHWLPANALPVPNAEPQP